MLTVDNINLHYGAAQALRGVSLNAEMGKITCVLGRNGVGKSSLLRAVTGQHAISGGSISFGGAPLMDVIRVANTMGAQGKEALAMEGAE